MSYKIICIFALSCLTVSGVIGDDEPCRPSLVGNVWVTQNATLHWYPSNSEECEVSHYIVTVVNRDTEDESTFVTEETDLDISFLPACQRSIFAVAVVSTDNATGLTRSLYTQLRPPADASLDVEDFEATPSDRTLLLEWKMPEGLEKCANQYRVMVLDEYFDSPTDYYITSNSYRVHNIVPCATYTFSVTALYSLETQGHVALLSYEAASDTMTRPILDSFSLGSSGASLSWNLEEYSNNRCEVTSVVVDISPYLTLTFPVTDVPHRPAVDTVVTNLRADTLYLLNVTAINTAGVSAPSLMAIQTLESD